MQITQNWVGYLDRSYEQIKRSLLKRLSTNAPEISDHSESNPFIVLIDMFAGVAEVLNLYVDSFAREPFLGTARKYSSMVKIVKNIDYNIKARNYATANLQFTLTDNLGLVILNPGYTIIIPKGTVVNPVNSNIPFRLDNDVYIPNGISSVYGLAYQYTDVINNPLGNTDGTDNQKFLLSDKYVNGSMKLLVGGIDYTLYNSFGLMGPTTKGFVIDIDENANAVLQFGDGINGFVPPLAQVVMGTYRESEGVIGNLPPGNITQILTPLTLPDGVKLTVNNPDYSSGGSDFEDIEQIRNRAPRSIRTLDRAVSYQDYIDIAMQVGGVGAAEVQYCCGKYVSVYIAPNSKGVATQALLNNVRDYLECRKMVTTMIDVKPAGVTRIWIKGKVIGKALFTATDISRQVINALDDEFGIGNVGINRKVSVTDIISLVEGLKDVDTFELEKVKIEPYARPLDNNSNTLNIVFTTLPKTTETFIYTLVYQAGPNNFQIFKAGIFLANVAIGVVFTDGDYISFQINAGVYADGNKWEFTVFPSYPEIFPNTLIPINDFSAPVIDVSPFIDDATDRTIFSDLTFQTQGSSSTCLAPC